ncbi:hypothetical protein A3E49_02190 [Candidatus Saccharibacteria bacterium RIFCSPHIGHO2_12_FULL_49_19]|nr:MAG: hypothetical protein A3E49_02190 [Candidatus Saccharibacteria bacterium RIFCSPHIGHO2_12_FULL_49_19]
MAFVRFLGLSFFVFGFVLKFLLRLFLVVTTLCEKALLPLVFVFEHFFYSSADDILLSLFSAVNTFMYKNPHKPVDKFARICFFKRPLAWRSRLSKPTTACGTAHSGRSRSC